jgi:hypothetical protein
VREIAKEFGGVERVLENDEVTHAGAEAVVMDKYNADWDPLYPFSLVHQSLPYVYISILNGLHWQFLSPYKIPLSVDSSYVSPWSVPETKFHIKAVDDVVDVAAGTRSLKLEVYHPELIWTGLWRDSYWYFD